MGSVTHITTDFSKLGPSFPVRNSPKKPPVTLNPLVHNPLGYFCGALSCQGKGCFAHQHADHHQRQRSSDASATEAWDRRAARRFGTQSGPSIWSGASHIMRARL